MFGRRRQLRGREPTPLPRSLRACQPCFDRAFQIFEELPRRRLRDLMPDVRVEYLAGSVERRRVRAVEFDAGMPGFALVADCQRAFESRKNDAAFGHPRDHEPLANFTIVQNLSRLDEHLAVERETVLGCAAYRYAQPKTRNAVALSQGIEKVFKPLLSLVGRAIQQRAFS